MDVDKSFAGYPLFLHVFVVRSRHFDQGQALGGDQVDLFCVFIVKMLDL